MRVPHLVQYQGSKRTIAPEIIKYFPMKFNRLIEPFSGTCAVTILTAIERKCEQFWVNDINEPLIRLMQECVNHPKKLVSDYSDIWNGQFCDGQNNIDYFYKIRNEFNQGSNDPARTLFLLARLVKGAVRYNSNGELNQSCDKRRNGTKPEMIEYNAYSISNLLKEKIQFSCIDYKEVLAMAKSGDIVYLDPPYQRTSKSESKRDHRLKYD